MLRCRPTRTRRRLQPDRRGQDALVLRCDEVDGATRDRLLDLWSIEDRVRDLILFKHQLDARLREPGISDEEAEWRCVEAAPAWYRVVVQVEPPFPLDLLDTGCPLAAVNESWRMALTAVEPALVAQHCLRAGCRRLSWSAASGPSRSRPPRSGPARPPPRPATPRVQPAPPSRPGPGGRRPPGRAPARPGSPRR
jgi:hypothetical protein